ncbi:unnamed protein product [Gordionus sp. m RMFG-2023]
MLKNDSILNLTSHNDTILTTLLSNITDFDENDLCANAGIHLSTFKYQENTVRTIIFMPFYIQYSAIIIYSLIFFFALIGNLIVIVVICGSKDMRGTTTYSYIANLAMADLLLITFCLPTAVAELFSQEIWPLGKYLCKAVPFLQSTVTQTSVLTILAISFERYFAICHPLKMQRYTSGASITRTIKYLSIIWGVSLLTSTPYIYITQYLMATHQNGQMVPICITSLQKKWEQIFFLFSVSIFYILPLIILVILYFKIVKVLAQSQDINNTVEKMKRKDFQKSFYAKSIRSRDKKYKYSFRNTFRNKACVNQPTNRPQSDENIISDSSPSYSLYQSSGNMTPLSKCEINHFNYDSDQNTKKVKGIIKYPSYEEKQGYSCDSTILENKELQIVNNLNRDSKLKIATISRMDTDDSCSIPENITSLSIFRRVYHNIRKGVEVMLATYKLGASTSQPNCQKRDYTKRCNKNLKFGNQEKRITSIDPNSRVGFNKSSHKYSIINKQQSKLRKQRNAVISKGVHHHSSKNASNQGRQQLIIMLIAVVFMFFICLLPFHGLGIWLIFVPHAKVIALGLEKYTNILCFTRIMYYLNSAINPILYNVISTKFRRAFYRALTSCCRKDDGNDWKSRTRSAQSKYISTSSDYHTSQYKKSKI